MDNQRTLFKKFFNSAAQTTQLSNAVKSPGGFNPPKFQFNKKKLGLGGSGLINNDEESKVVKEIDSIEIESELDALSTVESIDSVTDNVVVADSGTVANSVVTSATWNTLNTLNTVNVVKNSNNKPADPRDHHQRHDHMNINNNNNNSNISNSYAMTVEKNKQKYNLSNQLEAFSMQLESFEMEMTEKKNKLDSLLLLIDEKAGKHKREYLCV